MYRVRTEENPHGRLGREAQTVPDFYRLKTSVITLYIALGFLKFSVGKREGKGEEGLKTTREILASASAGRPGENVHSPVWFLRGAKFRHGDAVSSISLPDLHPVLKIRHA
jgi:hypothetical protein